MCEFDPFEEGTGRRAGGVPDLVDADRKSAVAPGRRAGAPARGAWVGGAVNTVELEPTPTAAKLRREKPRDCGAPARVRADAVQAESDLPHLVGPILAAVGAR